MREQTFATSAGIALNVARSESSGAPIVLLHGVTRSWRDWLVGLPYLMPHWHIAALDFRGHGRSARVPGAYLIADYVPDVVDFLRRELDEPAILVGHSLGGNVAAAAAAEVPERVRGLILEDPPLEMAGPALDSTYFTAMFRAFLPHAGSDRPVEIIARELADALVPAAGREGLVRFGDVRDAVALRSSAASLKRLDPEVLETAIGGHWLDRSDVRKTLRGIRCPTLLIQADPAVGGILPDSHAAEMAALIGDVIVMKLPGVPHNVHGTVTETMMRMVLAFLGSLAM